MSKKTTTKEWYARYPDLIPDQDLSFGNKFKAKFWCGMGHGEYFQSLSDHAKHGCRRCSQKNNVKKVSVEEWYERYSDLKPGQSKLEAHKNAWFICKKGHPDYAQTLSNHKKYGCPVCGYEKVRNDRTKGDDFWYNTHSDLKPGQTCLSSYQKAVFTCPSHGDYIQGLSDHYKRGCPECGKLRSIAGLSLGDDVWYERFPDLKLGQTNLRSEKKAIFICEKHGEYTQLLESHYDHGCPMCAMAKTPYGFLVWLRSIYSGEIILNDRMQIKPQEIDFYLPDLKIGFEFNDIHTHRNTYGTEKIGKPRKYHLNKSMQCWSNGIRLFHIWDIEWSDNRIRPILESVIKHALGMTERIVYARKCVVKELDSKEANIFFRINHIQGAATAVNGHYFGLSYGDELLGAICSTNIKGTHTISRMAFKMNVLVVGGQSKLMKAVERTLPFGATLDYLVLNDYFDGRSFKATGWEQVSCKEMNKMYDILTGKTFYATGTYYSKRKKMLEERTGLRYFTSGTTRYRKAVGT